ncbi:MAG: glutathione S-transferase [Pseudomonadota bacterium]
MGGKRHAAIIKGAKHRGSLSFGIGIVERRFFKPRAIGYVHTMDQPSPDANALTQSADAAAIAADQPVLYSFRRCPYAMRARLAIASSGVGVELREVLLRDKPVEMIAASPKATVPVLIERGTVGVRVVDESYDIMKWALARNDPDHWLGTPETVRVVDELVEHCEQRFKPDLDRYKYADRYDEPASAPRDRATAFIADLESRLTTYSALCGEAWSLADAALLPFVRQFAHVDREWFAAQPWPRVQRWLAAFIDSSAFATIMVRHKPWRPGDPPISFPPDEPATPSV